MLTTAPDIMEDEPWYANTAYNFTLGNWFNNTNTGHQGGDTFILYTFILGMAIKAFGCSLYVTRMVSVLAGIIAIWGLFRILKALRTSNLIQILVVLFFIFSNVTYVACRSSRPESLILAFGIWAIYWLIIFHETDKTKHVLLASVFATFSFLCHPHGILFLITTGTYLIFYSLRVKSLRKLLYFSFLCIGIITVHFSIVFMNPSMYLQNFINDLKDRNSVTNDTGFFDNIVNSYKIYTLGIKRLYILIFETGILIAGLIYSGRNKIIQYLAIGGLVTLTVSFTVFNPYSTRHFGEVFIYSFLVFALLYESWPKGRVKKGLLLLGAIYLLNNLAGDVYILYKKFNYTSYAQLEKQLSGSIPDSSVVLTSINFWYPLKNNETYTEYTYWAGHPTFKSLDSLIQSGEVDYTVISRYMVFGTTGTSGRTVNILSTKVDFYQSAVEYAETSGILIKKIPTCGFDTIKIYQMKY